MFFLMHQSPGKDKVEVAGFTEGDELDYCRRFTAFLEMHPSLAPGKRSCAPIEDMTTM
jgi:hypothetical protein